MHPFRPTFLCLLAAVSALPERALPAPPADFAHTVAPVLREHCAECHTGAKKKGGLSLNSRASLLEGGENGVVLVPGKPAESRMLEAMLSSDPDTRMPPKGPRVPPAQIEAVKAWIQAGAPWEDGLTLAKSAYEAPLKPRQPVLPAATSGRDHPIDRLLDADLARRRAAVPPPVPDGVFLRRVHLDLIGLLPTPAELADFTADTRPDKRSRKIGELLARDVDYAEHWLTFWNDLLRNDYDGTGFITGGRKQITKWLYQALVTNRPFDAMTRELVAPGPESEGFANGIKWRGEVSAGQTVEIQFSQSVSQSFLGINMKCASCHDSFVDRWKLDDAFGLAAIYSDRPLEIHRCDKPTGRTAAAAWMFPELGQIDPKAPRVQRLQQLAALLTHPENGRFTRTMANRLWHRMMGRGIVHPVDAMDTEPWHADLLDLLANELRANGHDIRRTLAFIANSQAYQSRAEVTGRDSDGHGYAYAGPRARRLTAEQFVDAVWQITGEAPAKFDAPVSRGRPDPATQSGESITGDWVWGGGLDAGRTISLSREWVLEAAPTNAFGVISVDNAYELWVNSRKVGADDTWETAESVDLGKHLRKGTNRVVVVATNGGSGPNLAGAFFLAEAMLPGGKSSRLHTDASWRWVEARPGKKGELDVKDADWQAAAVVAGPWAARLEADFKGKLSGSRAGASLMVRAALLKADFLQRSLGRPNRDQIVGMRPNDLTTLEAIDLANGPVLYETLAGGARDIAGREWKSPSDLVRWVYAFALSREPTGKELAVSLDTLGPSVSAQGVEDLLWSVCLLPEFLFVR